jgi:hypothetical protein
LLLLLSFQRIRHDPIETLLLLRALSTADRGQEDQHDGSRNSKGLLLLKRRMMSSEPRKGRGSSPYWLGPMFPVPQETLSPKKHY